ncbi:MAG: hypothetical protein HIU85_11115 [Proteobacteria bacterium]|nr:hypothetical protein [Pseudomonadota bacterium]
MSSSYRSFYVVLGAGALIGLVSRTSAANWEWLPRIEAGGTYNDNYRLADSSAGKVQVYGPYIDAQLAADLLSPRSELDIVPRVVSSYYPSDSADSSTNEYLDVNGAYRGLRSHFKGAARFSDETIIDSELLPAAFPGVALGQAVSASTGRVAFHNRRELERLMPQYTYDLTQRTHLRLSGQYEHASFSHSLFQQVGYQDYYGKVGMSFDVTPRSALEVSGVAARFLPQVGGHDTNRYGVDLQWNTQESQVMQAYLRLGASRLQAQTTFGTVSSNGVTGGAGVEWRYQITEVVLDVMRNLSPSDAGAEVVSDEARFRILHAFRPLLSGFFAARAVRVRGSSSQVPLTIDGEDYFTGEVGLIYQITMSWRVQGTYDYIWQRFQTSPSAASNAVTFSFVYQPLSRYEPLPEFTGIPRER